MHAPIASREAAVEQHSLAKREHWVLLLTAPIVQRNAIAWRTPACRTASPRERLHIWVASAEVPSDYWPSERTLGLSRDWCVVLIYLSSNDF